MNTDAINHDPAITFIQTGIPAAGPRPAWARGSATGSGSENQNLPAFVVLISQANALNPDQPLFSRLWGSGFLPSNYQGVRFRASRRSRALSWRIREGIDPADAPRHARRLGRAESHAPSRLTAIPKSRRASRSTRWRTACRPRCPI